MTWTQPNRDGTELREMSHPCINGCGGHWKHPAAEQGRVIGGSSDSAALFPRTTRDSTAPLEDNYDPNARLTEQFDQRGEGYVQAFLDWWGIKRPDSPA
ncbi:MAG: hypothetical protein ACRDQ5_29075 [Sciscionella sp.]